MIRQIRTASNDPVRRLRDAGLTRRQTECLSLYYFDGMSQAQIGVELGVGQRVVSQHVSYGRKKLVAAQLEAVRVVMEPPRMTQIDIDTIDTMDPLLLRAVW